MPRFLSKKITHNTNKQEDLKLNEKRESMNINTETIQMFELCVKVFKAAIIEIIQQTIINTLEQF